MKIRTSTNLKEIKSSLTTLRDSETVIKSRQNNYENNHIQIFRLNETEETFSFKSSYEFHFNQQGEILLETHDKSLQFKVRPKEIRSNYIVAHYPERILMEDTRKYTRVNFKEKNKTIMIRNTKGVTLKFQGVDISQGGLGLLGLEDIDTKLEIDEMVTIITIGKSRTLKTPAKVVFIRAQGAGNSRTFRVGLQLPEKYLFDEGLVSYFATQE